MKQSLLGVLGAVGSGFIYLLGGWDMALQTLLIFMAVDYITGLAVAGVFNKSTKSESGGLESKAGWKGLLRKGMTLGIVLVGAQLDKVTGTHIIRDAVIIAYIVNESLSILENAGLMGLRIPKALSKAIDVLKQKSEQEE